MPRPQLQAVTGGAQRESQLSTSIQQPFHLVTT